MQATDIIDKANSYSLFGLLGTMNNSNMIPLDYSVSGIINGLRSYRFYASTTHTTTSTLVIIEKDTNLQITVKLNMFKLDVAMTAPTRIENSKTICSNFKTALEMLDLKYNIYTLSRKQVGIFDDDYDISSFAPYTMCCYIIEETLLYRGDIQDKLVNRGILRGITYKVVADKNNSERKTIYKVNIGVDVVYMLNYYAHMYIVVYENNGMIYKVTIYNSELGEYTYTVERGIIEVRDHLKDYFTDKNRTTIVNVVSKDTNNELTLHGFLQLMVKNKTHS